jgi:hypothetical protein
VATARWNSRRGAAILASEVGGPSQGRAGEAACLSAGEKERSGEGDRMAANGF